MITTIVRDELLDHEDQTSAAIHEALKDWIRVCRGPPPSEAYLRLGLGLGEASTVAFARNGDTLIIDDKQGRALAHQLGKRSTGLLGLLAEVVRLQRITSAEATETIGALEQAGFWMAPSVRKKALDAVQEASRQSAAPRGG